MFTHINPSTNKARLVLAIAIPILVLALSWVSTGQTIHLELLHAWDGFREPLVNQMLEEFMQEHPHIKVTTRLVKTTALEEQFTVTYAGGVAPDVVMLWSKHVIAHATKGSLLPLNDFIEADGISRDIWIPSEITNSEWNGKLYGFPIRTGGEDGNILYYNKQLFSEAGLDAHVPPETWDDLLAYSKRLVRYHGDLLVLNPIMNLDDGATIRPTLNWLYAGGSQYLSDDLRSIAWDNATTAATMDWVYRFIQEVYRNPNDRKTPRSDFYAGQTAMMLWGSEGFSFVWDYDPDFPLGVGTRPKLPESNYLGANYQTWNYAISATTQHPEAAFELLKWLTIREESAGWFMRMQGRPSPVRAFNSHPDYAEINPYVPVLAQILENVAPLGLLPVNDDIGIPLRNAFRSVLAGETSAASALSAAAPVSQAVLDEFWASYDATQ